MRYFLIKILKRKLYIIFAKIYILLLFINTQIVHIFQKKNLGVQNYLKFGDLPCEVEEVTRKLWSASQNTLDIEITVSEDGKTFVELDYDTGNYSENAMKNFADIMDEILLKMQEKNISVHEILN